MSSPEWTSGNIACLCSYIWWHWFFFSLVWSCGWRSWILFLQWELQSWQSEELQHCRHSVQVPQAHGCLWDRHRVYCCTRTNKSRVEYNGVLWLFKFARLGVIGKGKICVGLRKGWAWEQSPAVVSQLSWAAWGGEWEQWLCSVPCTNLFHLRQCSWMQAGLWIMNVGLVTPLSAGRRCLRHCRGISLLLLGIFIQVTWQEK